MPLVHLRPKMTLSYVQKVIASIFSILRMNWFTKLREIHARRDSHQDRARKLCEANEHVLFAFDQMGSTRCRKCGQTVFCHNIFAQTSYPDFTGAATINKCPVPNGGTFGHFTQPAATNTVL